MSIHYLEELSSGSRESIFLHIRWNDARLIIRFDQDPSGTAARPIENSFIERYNAACDDDDYDEAEALSDEILSAVVKRGRQIFDQIAPPCTSGTSASHNLHTLLFPREYNFRFRTLDSHAEMVHDNTHSMEGGILDGPFGPFHLSVDQSCNLPRYSTKDICVLDNLANNGYIARVAVNGQEMCSKAGDTKGEIAAQRELDCLWKITASDCATSLRVPKILGLIENPTNKRIIGFLEEYIPVSDSWELSTLGSIETASSIAESRRKKWALQVQETIKLLHQIGVIWGDGKASNVLIHRDSDDAWVIDFGGGWTDGWLDQDLGGTVEGDEMAVRKIFEYLEV